MVKVDYGMNFKKARERKRLSQAEAAEALDISAPFLSQIESNKKKPSVDLIFRAAELYDVDKGYFFQTKEEVNIEKINTETNREFINDLSRLNPEELKQKYSMKFIGDDITNTDIKAMIAYLKTLKSMD